MWDIPIGAGDIAKKVTLDTVGGPKVATVADWDMVNGDTIASGKVTERVFGAQLSVSSAGDAYLASVVDGDATVPALTLPGAEGQRAAMSWSPMSTATSFSVSASVRVTDPTRPAVIAQQAGANAAAWTLGYRPKTDGTAQGQFYFRMSHEDSPTAAFSEVRLDVNSTDIFNAVTGVFDADREGGPVIYLALNGGAWGQDDGSAEAPVPEASFSVTPWQASGGFGLGNGTTTTSLSGTQAPLNGDIAHLKLFAGAWSLDAISKGEDGITPPVDGIPVGTGPSGEVVSVDFADGTPHERVQANAPRTFGAPTYETDSSLNPSGPTDVMRSTGDDAVSFAIDPWADLSTGFTLECVFRIEASLPVSREMDLCANKEAGGFGVLVNAGELRTLAYIGGGYQSLATPAEANRWYHTLTVWDGATLTFFVNGVRVAETAAGGVLTPPVSTARRFVVGADSGTNDTVHAYGPAASFAKAGVYARPVSPVEASTMAAAYHTEPPAATDPTQESADVLGVDFKDQIARDRVSGVIPRIWGSPTYPTDSTLRNPDGTGNPVGVMKVDGVDDAVSFDINPWADLTAAGTDGFTLECVVKVDSMPSGTTERDLCSDKESGGFGLYVSGTSLTATAHIGGAYRDVSTTIVAGRWYHVAVTWNGSVLTLYLDGYRKAELATSGALTPPSTTARKFVIGADPNNVGGIQFPAPPSTFARVAIYGRGLTYNEVLAMATPWLK
jgi:hypothetical protein